MESKGDELASEIKHPSRIKHPALCHIPHARMDTKITIRITKTLPSVKVWKALELALLSPYFAKPNKCNHYQWCNYYHCFNLPFPPTRIESDSSPPPALWAQRHVHPPEHLNPSAPGRLNGWIKETNNWSVFRSNSWCFWISAPKKYDQLEVFFRPFSGWKCNEYWKNYPQDGPPLVINGVIGPPINIIING